MMVSMSVRLGMMVLFFCVDAQDNIRKLRNISLVAQQRDHKDKTSDKEYQTSDYGQVVPAAPSGEDIEKGADYKQRPSN